MQSVFEISIVACSLVGILSAAHLATLLVRSKIVSALDMTKIVTLALIATAIAIFGCNSLENSTDARGLFRVWLLSQLPIAMAISGAFLLAKHRDRAVENSLEELLSRLMMRMKEGRSLAIALELVASESRSSLRPRWLEIARSVSFSPQENLRKGDLKSLRLLQIARELQKIAALPRSQLIEIERWRVRIRTARTFRRKSVQAMAQVRAQALILAVIYSLLSMFSISAFGWISSRSSFQLSLPLFLLGLYFIWRGGRRVKWSV